MLNPLRDSLQATLAERSIADALRSWALPLGCPMGYLQHQRSATVEREWDKEPVVRTFTRDGVGLVSVPSADALDLALDEAETETLLSLTRREARPGSVVELRAVQLMVSEDPAALALLDIGTLLPRGKTIAALVYDPAPIVLDMLRNDVTPWEWKQAGGLEPAIRRVGALSGGVLVALASMDAPVGHLARVRVLVAPRHRRLGFGRVVLHALSRHVLDAGLLPYYRLSMNDLAARAMMRAVGFVTFAKSLTMRAASLQPVDSVYAGI